MDPITLQELLDALSDGGDPAALLASETRSVDLPALESEALESFDRLRGGEAPLTDNDVEALEALASAVEAVRTETGRRAEESQATQTRVDELASRLRPEAEAGGEPAGDGAGEAAAGDGGDGAGEAAGEQPAGQEAAGQEQAAELVTAAGGRGRRVDLASIARRTPRPVPSSTSPKLHDVLSAAADVPGVPTGAGYPSWTEVAEAALRRIGSMPRSAASGGGRYGIAVMRKQFGDHLVADGSGDDESVLDAAADEHALSGGSLLAAGGWCAPSETLYDLVELEGTDGTVDLPEINASRGGIRFTPGPDYCAIYNSAAYWVQTEAEVEASTTKPVVEVPCPEFSEIRLDAVGLAISSGILTQRAYPELVARFIRGALAAHVHRLSAEKINRMVAAADDYGTLSLGDGGAGATSEVLSAIELQAEAYRYRSRMPRGSTLEMVAPFWLRGVVRADLANRNGVDMLAVTDAQIDAWFALRGVRPQWVYDWQPLDGCGDGSTAPADVVDWPATAQLLMYAAGTFVAATSDIITLDAIYDSTNIKTNRYTALFSEEGLAVAKRGHDARLFTVAVCPSGTTGDQTAIACTGA